MSGAGLEDALFVRPSFFQRRVGTLPSQFLAFRRSGRLSFRPRRHAAAMEHGPSSPRTAVRGLHFVRCLRPGASGGYHSERGSTR
jgi:hypothetical protein